MARLETIIDGSAEGLETAASRAIGILEGLQKVADKLKIDLFQATTVQELNSVGVALTAVTGRYNDYINTALRGNSVWQDQQAAKALENLDAKLRVVNGNAELFGRTMAVDRQEVRAYQAALDSLLKIGLDPTDARIKDLVTNINRLNSAISAASQGRNNPFSQFENASGIIGNLENRLKNLRQALRDATDTRQIVSLNRRIRETGDELARIRGLGGQATGMLGRLEAESKRLRTALTFAQSERELEKLGAEIREVEGEIARLNNVAGVMNRRFGQDGRQSFNQFGLEFGRVIQDLPYAANNFGSIGNNITRMVEVFPGYIAMLRATVIAQGQAATGATLMRAAFQSFFTGANAWLLGISALVTAITFYTQWQQRSRREAEKAAKQQKDALQVLREYINGLDSLSRAQGRAAEGYASELAQARLLYNQTQDATLSIEARRKAVEELKKQFPTYFKGLSTEAVLTGNAADAYERLTKNLIASQTARATEELTSEALKEQIQLRIRERAVARETLAANTRLAELAREEAELLRMRVRTQGDIQFQNQRQNEIIRERTDLQKQLVTAQNQGNTDTLRQTELQSQLAEYQQIFNQATQEALNSLGLFPEETKKTADNTKKAAGYAEQMASAFTQATNREEVDSRTGLDALTERTRQNYEKVYNTLNRLQAEWQTKYKQGTKERMALDELAANYRIQLGIKEADELLRNEDEFNRQMEEKRRKDLSDRVDIEIDTQRRINERRSQTLLRALNNEMKIWEKAAEDRVRLMAEAGATETEVMAAQLREQEKLQENYWKRLEEIQQFERMENLALEFGEAFSRAFETSLSDGKNIFEQIYQEFRRLIIRMIAQQAALKAANIFGQLFGVGNVGDSSRGGSQATFGDLLKGLAGIFGNSGSGGKWVTSVGNIFKNSGQGGQWIGKLGQVFTSNSGGGGFLRALGSIFSSVSGGGGGGWFGKLLGSIFGGSKYRSGNFPTGNFGGGNFPQYDNPQRVPAFVPGLQAGTQTENITLNARIGHDAIYLSNKMGAQKNDRFYGGK